MSDRQANDRVIAISKLLLALICWSILRDKKVRPWLPLFVNSLQTKLHFIKKTVDTFGGEWKTEREKDFLRGRKAAGKRSKFHPMETLQKSYNIKRIGLADRKSEKGPSNFY